MKKLLSTKLLATLCIVAATLLSSIPALAQDSSLNTNTKESHDGWWAEYSDSTTEFRATQLIAPGALFTLGALGVGENAPLRRVNLAVKEGVFCLSKGQPLHFDDYLQYAPIATHLALCLTPVKAKYSAGERVAAAVVAYASMGVLVNSLKYTVREMRPDGSRRNSFPSGHTATAFMGAELVRAEYGWGIGSAAYIAATTVAFMRIYNNRHWMGDVLGGAAVGIISARIGYWLLPLSRKIFKMKPNETIATAPLYHPEQRAVGLSCAICF